jgi:hypothetical protein
MSGYASSGITTLRGIDRLESIRALYQQRVRYDGMCGLMIRRGPEGRPPNISPARKSLRENLLDKAMGAPGLAFETWDPSRKCRRIKFGEL